MRINVDASSPDNAAVKKMKAGGASLTSAAFLESVPPAGHGVYNASKFALTGSAGVGQGPG